MCLWKRLTDSDPVFRHALQLWDRCAANVFWTTSGAAQPHLWWEHFGAVLSLIFRTTCWLTPQGQLHGRSGCGGDHHHLPPWVGEVRLAWAKAELPLGILNTGPTESRLRSYIGAQVSRKRRARYPTVVPQGYARSVGELQKQTLSCVLKETFSISVF